MVQMLPTRWHGCTRKRAHRHGDEAVLRYVLSRPGAIGYVSDRAQIGTAKVLSVR
jgi:hypothetical protein